MGRTHSSMLSLVFWMFQQSYLKWIGSALGLMLPITCYSNSILLRTYTFIIHLRLKGFFLVNNFIGFCFQSLWRCVPGVAVYFTSIEAMKYLFLGSNKQHSLNTIQALTIGASSRTITAALLMPFTVIKTRFEVKKKHLSFGYLQHAICFLYFFNQSGHYNYKSVLHALATVYRSEGGRGLMTGLTATIARDVPFSAIYFAAYSHLKQLQLEVK